MVSRVINLGGGPAGTAVDSERLRESTFQKLSELRSRLELRNGIQFLERRRKCIREAPDRVRSELFVLWLEVQIVHGARQVFRCFQSSPANAS